MNKALKIILVGVLVISFFLFIMTSTSVPNLVQKVTGFGVDWIYPDDFTGFATFFDAVTGGHSATALFGEDSGIVILESWYNSLANWLTQNIVDPLGQVLDPFHIFH